MTGIELQFTIALRYRYLLTRTLDASRLAHIDAKSVVVSRDNNALDLAARLGSHALTGEPSNPLSLEILGAIFTLYRYKIVRMCGLRKR